VKKFVLPENQIECPSCLGEPEGECAECSGTGSISRWPLPLPMAVWQGTFTLFGVELRCSVLDNGARVINAEDVQRLFHAMGDPGVSVVPAEIERFARWRAGHPQEADAEGRAPLVAGEQTNAPGAGEPK
jgi:hypothetical protein